MCVCVCALARAGAGRKKRRGRRQKAGHPPAFFTASFFFTAWPLPPAGSGDPPPARAVPFFTRRPKFFRYGFVRFFRLRMLLIFVKLYFFSVHRSFVARCCVFFCPPPVYHVLQHSYHHCPHYHSPPCAPGPLHFIHPLFAQPACFGLARFFCARALSPPTGAEGVLYNFDSRVSPPPFFPLAPAVDCVRRERRKKNRRRQKKRKMFQAKCSLARSQGWSYMVDGFFHLGG